MKSFGLKEGLAIVKYLFAVAAVALVSCDMSVTDGSERVLIDFSAYGDFVEARVDVEGEALSGGNELARAVLAARSVVDRGADEDVTVYDLWVLQLSGSGADDYVIEAQYIADYNLASTSKSVQLRAMENTTIIYIANTNNETLYADFDSSLIKLESIYADMTSVTEENSLFSPLTMDLRKPIFLMSNILSGVTIYSADNYVDTSGQQDYNDANNVTLSSKALQRNLAKIEVSVTIYDDENVNELDWVDIQLCNVPTQSSRLGYVAATANPLGVTYPSATSYYDYPAELFSENSSKDVDGDVTTLTYYYYVPVNVRGEYDNVSNSSSYKYYTFSNKASTAKSGYIENPTYFRLTGSMNGDAQSGGVWNVTFEEYVGADCNSYDVEANCVYAYNIGIGGLDSATASQDARFTLDFEPDVTKLWDGGELSTWGNTSGYNTSSIANSVIVNNDSSDFVQCVSFPVLHRINQYYSDSSEGYGSQSDLLAAAQAAFNSDNWKAVILWHDFTDATNLDKKIRVKKDANNSGNLKIWSTESQLYGNAIIGIVSADLDTDGLSDASTVEATIATLNSTTGYGEVLWTFHAWFTDYDPYTIVEANRGNIDSTTTGRAYAYYANGTSTYNSATSGVDAVHRYEIVSGGLWAGDYKTSFIMDRNLGARDTNYPTTGAGALYYQFGRSVPIPGGPSDGATTSGYLGTTKEEYHPSSYTRTTVSTIAIAISSPLTSYVLLGAWSTDATSTSYAWYDSKVGSTANGKSIYDPSPAGWRVPRTGVWDSYTTSVSSWSSSDNIGRTYRSIAYYPAAGLRLQHSMLLWFFGTNCYAYNSTPISQIAGDYLTMTSTSAFGSDNQYSTRAHNVRPISEPI